MFSHIWHKLAAIFGTAAVVLPAVSGYIPSGAPKLVSAVLGAALLIATTGKKVISVFDQPRQP